MCVSAAAFVIASAPGAFRAVYSVGAMCVTRASMHSSVDGLTATIAPVARGRSSTHSRWVNAELHIQASAMCSSSAAGVRYKFPHSQILSSLDVSSRIAASSSVISFSAMSRLAFRLYLVNSVSWVGFVIVHGCRQLFFMPVHGHIALSGSGGDHIAVMVLIRMCAALKYS